MDEIIKNGTFEDVLLDCGWVKVEAPKRHWVPPTPVAHLTERIEVPC